MSTPAPAWPSLGPRRFAAAVGGSFALLVLVLVAAPLVGSTSIDLGRAFDASVPLAANPDRSILFQVRLPRSLAGALVGGALAVSGLALQSLLRNPLASPFTLGISGGASLAAALAIRFGLETRLGPLVGPTAAAWAGSAVAAALVYALSRAGGRLAPPTLLLAGVTLHFFFSSLILLIQYTADFTQSYQMVRWFMGGLDLVEMDRLVVVAPFVVVSVAVLVRLARELNALALGDDTAASLGVPVERVRLLTFGAASLATGSALSLSGPLLFVGLMVPHLLRLVLGADHRVLVPCAVFAGGALVVACDTVARTLLAPTEIPVGVITALAGGPFFLWLLLRRRLEGLDSP